MVGYTDPREMDGGVKTLADLHSVQYVAADALGLLGARTLSCLCNVSKPTIHRYARGTTNPTPANAARIRFALSLGTLLKYQYNARVAETFFNVGNPWLGGYFPVAVLAKHPPGSDAWDRVGFACSDFLFGYERGDGAMPSSRHRNDGWPPLDMS